MDFVKITTILNTANMMEEIVVYKKKDQNVVIALVDHFGLTKIMILEQNQDLENELTL